MRSPKREAGSPTADGAMRASRARRRRSWAPQKGHMPSLWGRRCVVRSQPPRLRPPRARRGGWQKRLPPDPGACGATVRNSGLGARRHDGHTHPQLLSPELKMLTVLATLPRTNSARPRDSSKSGASATASSRRLPKTCACRRGAKHISRVHRVAMCLHAWGICSNGDSGNHNGWGRPLHHATSAPTSASTNLGPRHRGFGRTLAKARPKCR